MRTSGETFKHVGQTSSLPMAGGPVTSFSDLSSNSVKPDENECVTGVGVIELHCYFVSIFCYFLIISYCDLN